MPCIDDMGWRNKLSNDRSSSLQMKTHEVFDINAIVKNKYVDNKKESSGRFRFVATISKLLRFNSTLDATILVIGTVAAALNGTLPALSSLTFGSLSATFIEQEKIEQTKNISIPERSAIKNYLLSEITDKSVTLFYFGVASFFLGIIQIVSWEIVSINLSYNLRRVFLAQCLRQDATNFENKTSKSDLTTTLGTEADQLKTGFGSNVSLVIYSISSVFVGVVVGLVKTWRLTLVAMTGSVFVVAASTLLLKRVGKDFINERIRYAEAGSIAKQVITNVKTVYSFGNESEEVNKFTRAVAEGRRLTVKSYYFHAWASSFSVGLPYALYSGLFYFAGQMISHESLPVSSLFTVIKSVVAGALNIGNSLNFITDVAEALGSSSNLFDTIYDSPQIDAYSREGCNLKRDYRGKFKIVFSNVFFSYPTRPSALVLRGINLEIRTGHVVAFVGTSGAGKSTLVNLILRFHDPFSGKILVDGINVKKLNLSSLRYIAGVVSQEPVLFNVSILENIRYGWTEASFEDIRQAAIKANAHDFIQALPHGYQTIVGERGTRLSGGQKQRVAIARALVRDPQILILDEATSALDSQSEALVQSALEKAMAGRTTLIIAHRLSTVRNADVIHVMDSGEIVESGSHEELIRRKGAYYNLVRRQERNFDITDKNTPADLLSAKDQRNEVQNPISECFRSKIDEKLTFLDVFKLGKWKLTFWSLSSCILLSTASPIFSYIYSDVVMACTLPSGQLERAFLVISIYLVILGFSAGLLKLISVLTSSFATESFIEGVRSHMFFKIMSQKIDFFDDVDTSPLALINNLNINPPKIKKITGMRLANTLLSLFSGIISLVICYVLFWQVAVLVTLAVPIFGYAAFRQTLVSLGSHRREHAARMSSNRLAAECFDNIKTVQVLGLEEHMLETYGLQLKSELRSEKMRSVTYAVAYALTICSQFLVTGACYLLGGTLIINNQGSTRQFFTAAIASSSILSAVPRCLLFIEDISEIRAALTDAVTILNLPMPRKDGLLLQPAIKGKVEFRNVYFSYPSNKNQDVIKGLNLTVSSGQTVALVGHSGCGKSTVFNLIEGFYQVSKGEILIDDINLQNLDLKQFRNHIGVVTQEPALFDMSIRDNIAYGATSLGATVTDEQIEIAAKEANIHEFVVNLPQGYDTHVGNRGCSLSGGQKQRIAIARALIRNPTILLLDEATSALDAESEKSVQDALERARYGRTILIIAHRLSTIKGADLIVVMDDGRVVEKGTHQELASLNGKYSELLSHQ